MGDATHGRRESVVGEATCGSGESAARNAICDWEKDVGAPQPPVTNIFGTQHMDKPTSRLAPRTGVTDGWGMSTADLPLVKVEAVMLEVV